MPKITTSENWEYEDKWEDFPSKLEIRYRSGDTNVKIFYGGILRMCYYPIGLSKLDQFTNELDQLSKMLKTFKGETACKI